MIDNETPDLEADELEPVETGEAVEPETPVETAPDDSDDDGELIVAFEGDEPVAAPAKAVPDNSVLRDMRRKLREQAAELARFKAQAPVAAPVEEDLGPIPTIEDFDFDAVKLDAAIRERAAKMVQIERAKVEREREAAKRAAEEAADRDAYIRSRAALGARDYEDAEASFVEAIPNEAFQRLVVRAADDPAKLIYALHKSPARMAELAAITDPAKMAAAVGKLEAKLKVEKVSKVQPERRVVGSATLRPDAYEAKLAELRAKAERTGDFSPVLEYKRLHREKLAARS